MRVRIKAAERSKRRRPTISSMTVLRSHRSFGVVLAIAAVVRLAFWIGLWPALTFTDSWSYLKLALSRFPVGISATRVSGYPLIIRLLFLPGKSLAWLTFAQHVSGLVVGCLVYALLLRLGTRRWVAIAAAAIVLFDAYVLMLEQFVASDALSVPLVMSSVWMVIVQRRDPRWVAASGVLLAAALLVRGENIFVVPVWLIYVAWTSTVRRTGQMLVALSSVLLPLLTYAFLHAVVGQGFAITNADGWLLYGRVASLTDCAPRDVSQATRALCETSPRQTDPMFYVWSNRSPARRRFPDGINQANNRVLRNAALTTIKHHPISYLRLVGGDFLRGYRPSGGRIAGDLTLNASGESLNGVTTRQLIRQSAFPDYRHPTVGPHSPIARYEHWLRVPRLFLGVTGLVSLLALVRSAASRRPGSRYRELFLLIGAALLGPLGAVATVEMWYRYFVSFYPLLVAAGALALSEALPALRRGSARSSTSAPGPA